MDVLVVLVAWVAGSVLVSLVVGAVIAGADRSTEPGRAAGADERPARRSLGTATDPRLLAEAR